MIPLTIHIDNCNELIPDWRRRILSSEARKWADADHPPRTKWKTTDDYWSGIIKEHEKLFWWDVYKRRKERIKRMKERS